MSNTRCHEFEYPRLVDRKGGEIKGRRGGKSRFLSLILDKFESSNKSIKLCKGHIYKVYIYNKYIAFPNSCASNRIVLKWKVEPEKI